MVKDPPLASAAQRTTARSVPVRTLRETRPTFAAKSSIPKSVSATPAKTGPTRPPPRIPAPDPKTRAALTRTGRSPKPGRKPTNSIEK
ncbi:unnamed protein product [Strongylus vulgaris]|uniref:Uncharacterized protein n=1 Tax=Strongylus vulgaris TaxID=40348 RepID=A0A3P7JH97_STRVU|nr:unnamed protein product [Strongylus vulgaris]